jgi:hypothetical protein
VVDAYDTPLSGVRFGVSVEKSIEWIGVTDRDGSWKIPAAFDSKLQRGCVVLQAISTISLNVPFAGQMLDQGLKVIYPAFREHIVSVYGASTAGEKFVVSVSPCLSGEVQPPPSASVDSVVCPTLHGALVDLGPDGTTTITVPDGFSFVVAVYGNLSGLCRPGAYSSPFPDYLVFEPRQEKSPFLRIEVHNSAGTVAPVSAQAILTTGSTTHTIRITSP